MKDKSNKPKGKSKYQLKVIERRKLCRKLGLPMDTPYPVINVVIDKVSKSS